MSKQAPAPAPAEAAAPPPPAAYGAAAMTDLLEHVTWSGCEVLNAVKKDSLGNVLKQGLRDQEDLLLESDADEQLLLTIAFKGPMKVHSLQVDAPSDGRAPKARANGANVNIQSSSRLTPASLCRRRSSSL